MMLSLTKDKDWEVIDGELCKVVSFTPLGTKVVNGTVESVDKTTPYASVELECKKISGPITGYITHYLDFLHLWKAFEEHGVAKNQEVLLFWTKQRYKNKISKLLSKTMPKLWVMICPKGAYDLTNNYDNKDFRPELTGGARARAIMPIVDWKPEVME